MKLPLTVMESPSCYLPAWHIMDNDGMEVARCAGADKTTADTIAATMNRADYDLGVAIDLLRLAVYRIDLSLAESDSPNPIMSAWLPLARNAINRYDNDYRKETE